MTDIERLIKIQKANDAVDKMKNWYKERTLPDRIRINPCQVIFSPENYVKTAFDTLEHSEVLSPHFRAAYFRLFNLKQQIEKLEKHEKIHGSRIKEVRH